MDAIAFTCAEHFLQLHPSFAWIMRPLEVRVSMGDLTQKGRYSWIAQGGTWFTVVRYQRHTVVFSHDTQMAYYASPNVTLPVEMPDGYAFLCQATLDDGQYPRLLVLDLILPRHKDVEVRGNLLRSVAHLFPPSMHLQWSGELEVLRKFLHKGLPHPVEAIVMLTEDPHVLVREHRLKTNE